MPVRASSIATDRKMRRSGRAPTVIGWAAIHWPSAAPNTWLEPHRLTVAALSVMAVAGGVLAGLSPNSPAVIVGCMVAVTAGAALAADISLGIIGATVAAFLAAGLAAGAQTGHVIGCSFGFAGLGTAGMTRRSHRLRGAQARRM